MRSKHFTTLIAIIALTACAPVRMPSIVRRPPAAKVLATSRASDALARASSAWTSLGSIKLSSAEEQRLIALHAQATGELVDAIDFTSPDSNWRGTRFVATPGGPIAVRLSDGKTPGEIAPGSFDTLHTIRKPKLNSAVPGALRTGVGIPLTAGRTNRSTPGFPPHGQYSPVTASLEFTGGPGSKTATLRFYDSRITTSIRVGARQFPLAANFAEPARQALGESNFVLYALGGLLRPELFFERGGVFLTEPYDPRKLPIVFVHGLQSEPSIWQNAAAAVMSDPVLGPRCQVWYFVYPTALSVPRSAGELRERLGRIRNDYRDTGGLVFVGHSMGGLLSRFQVIDPGDKLWHAYFTKPPGRLNLRGDLLREARTALIFPAQTDVQRVIFIATPHRGSKLADWFVTRMLKRLVRLPQKTLTFVKELLEMNLSVVQPAAIPYLRLGGTSLDTLSPTHPYFAAMEQCKIRAPFHSIIGNRGDKHPLAGTSDGVVPYSSAHLEGARSEYIVPHGHSCVREADVIAEITRILRENSTPQRRIDPAAKPRQ